MNRGVTKGPLLLVLLAVVASACSSPVAPAPVRSQSLAPSVRVFSAVRANAVAGAVTLLPERFIVTVGAEQMRFGPLSLSIICRAGRFIAAVGLHGARVEIDHDTWTYIAPDGFARGRLDPVAPLGAVPRAR